jgi:hypothetical protein
MRREKVGHPLSFLFLNSVERLEETNGLARVVAGPGAIVDTQLIGFQFVVAAVAEEEQLRGHAAEVHKVPGGKPEDSLAEQRAAEKEPLTDLLLPGLARGVAGGHMADFVGQDGGKLVLVVQIGEHPAGHIDVASGRAMALTIGLSRMVKVTGVLRISSGVPGRRGDWWRERGCRPP